MKIVGRVVFAVLSWLLMLVGGMARLIAQFLAAGSGRDDPEAGEIGAGVLGRNDIAPVDYGAGGVDVGGDTYTGFTVHGREPITVGRNGEQVGAYSGDPIIHF